MSDLCYDIAIMQPQTNNPFPLSDTSDKDTPPTPNPVTPMPKTAEPVPTVAAPSVPNSVFVLPSEAAAQSITLSGPLASIEKLLIKLFSHPALQLPEFIKDMFARYLPWMTLMSIFMLVPILFIGIVYCFTNVVQIKQMEDRLRSNLSLSLLYFYLNFNSHYRYRY